MIDGGGMRDHGGNMDDAIARHGAGDWLDLSTGINRRPWPVPPLPEAAWRALPTRADQQALAALAAQVWAAAPGVAGVALGGAQAAIQLIPRLGPPGRARVLSPTYNEHAACLVAEGWAVTPVARLADLEGADLAVVVNPNNPDGQTHDPGALTRLSAQVGRLVVDESFADMTPALSVLPLAGDPRLVVLRSFGKFYGLAGARLGFAFGAAQVIDRLSAMAGPWPVSGPALAIGRAALADRGWAEAMRAQLARDAARADALATGAGWGLVGGTTLFRLYDTPDAAAAQEALARHHIWTRIFPWSRRWLRLGLPGPEGEWDRLAGALTG